MPRRLLAALLVIATFAACSSPVPTASPSGGTSSLAPSATATTTAPGAPGTSSAPGTSVAPGTSADPAATPPPSSPPGGSPIPVGSALDPALAQRLQAVLDRTVAKAKIPGLSAAVLLSDGRTWVGTSGDRQLSPARPVDQGTVFAIASITKTFVTAAVMQLIDEGKLSLSDHLSRWLPAVQNAGRITIKELLGHTSGIYNYFENPSYPRVVFKDPKKVWTFDQIMALVKAPYCAPGHCYHYSNTNFVLLGRIVELVTGDSLASEIARRFIGPLSLDLTGYQPDDPTPADHAHGYTGATDWTRNSKVIPSVSTATIAGAAGAMFSDPLDLARWASSLYTGAVVPQAELSQMLQFQTCHDNYGLGTREYIINGRVAYGHLGGLRGFSDAMWYFPAEGATVVLLSNLGIWNLDAAVRKLQSVLFSGITVPAPAFDPSTNTRNHDGVTLRC